MSVDIHFNFTKCANNNRSCDRPKSLFFTYKTQDEQAPQKRIFCCWWRGSSGVASYVGLTWKCRKKTIKATSFLSYNQFRRRVCKSIITAKLHSWTKIGKKFKVNVHFIFSGFSSIWAWKTSKIFEFLSSNKKL